VRAAVSHERSTPDKFVVDLDGPADRLGLSIIEHDLLSVLAVGEGTVSVWNRAHPELAVRENDVILSVNGHKEPSEMLAQLTMNGRRHVVLRRPFEEIPRD